MKHFPPNIQFKYDWRKYQARVLSELTEHLDDNHLHIIAPPGSGKTVLGLEVSLRLNKPTLILAPTIAIRDQWIHRFCELFLQVKQQPDWISRDIKAPNFFTVATYQALHAACTGAADEEEQETSEEESNAEKETKANEIEHTKTGTGEIIDRLRAQAIGTIVVDEAHHLKNAWWQTLTTVKTALEPTIVGLTATPPYDVTYTEWQRYIDLNGPVDTEITVPELVVEGDLCPHQDHVFFSIPTNQESQKIQAYRERIKVLFQEIKMDQELIQAVESHPIFEHPKEHLDWIYTNLSYYSATLIFLNAVGKNISDDHLEVVGDKEFTIPELNYEWVEHLLTFYLFKDPDHFGQFETHQAKLIQKLKRKGAMERRTINFRDNRKINSFLGSSISKLDSIDQIVDFEHDHLRQDLRMVILTDFIRKEFLINESQNDLPLNKIGVIPIFEKLRRTNERQIKIGVLTGSLIIIPSAALDIFNLITAKYNIDNLSTIPLPFDAQYLIIKTTESIKHHMVHIITQIFQKGEIEVLVGTKSLLGEGWDAPSINALILASFVGSYVLSNQMRGRAIRTQRQNLDKTGNIWHLVCMDPTASNGGDDIELLERRFKAFVGVSFRDEVNIENGISRLDLPKQIKTAKEVDQINKQMLKAAGQRDQLKRKWHKALEEGVVLIEEIKMPFPEEQNYQAIKSLHYYNTIKFLMGMLGSGLINFGFAVFIQLGKIAPRLKSKVEIIIALMVFGGLGIFYFGRLATKTFQLYVKYRDIANDVHQIGKALLATLVEIEAIQTPIYDLNVVANIDESGSIYCHLEGGTTFEKSAFIKSLHEIIGVVDNPKYVIIRKSKFLKIISQKDYHSVPEIIGRKKAFAKFFEEQWKKRVGKAELIYTRNIEGRKLLLKSRMHSLASEFEDKTERVNKWR